MLTHIFTKHAVDAMNGESIIRSWLSKVERPTLFVPIPDPTVTLSLPPESILLNNVLRNSSNVLNAYTNILGVPPPQAAPSTPQITSPPSNASPTSFVSPNQENPSPDRSSITHNTTTSPPPPVPDLASPPRRANVYNSSLPLSKKRPASTSPSSDQSSEESSLQLL